MLRHRRRRDLHAQMAVSKGVASRPTRLLALLVLRFIVIAHLDIVQELDAKWDRRMCSLPQGKSLRRRAATCSQPANSAINNAIPSRPLTPSPRAFRNRRPGKKGLHSADDGEYAIQSAANGQTRLDPEIVTRESTFPIDKMLYTVAGLRAMAGPSKISR